MTDVRSAVRDFLLNECLPGESPANLKDDTPLQSSGILDSMKTLQLVDLIEKSANIEIEPHEVSPENFETVASIVGFVSRRSASG
jgi:acyl carrier protein